MRAVRLSISAAISGEKYRNFPAASDCTISRAQRAAASAQEQCALNHAAEMLERLLSKNCLRVVTWRQLTFLEGFHHHYSRLPERSSQPETRASNTLRQYGPAPGKLARGTAA